MFPPFLVPDFDEADLDASRSSIAAVVPNGTIVWVNRAWKRRAKSQRFEGSLTDRSYFEAIASPELRVFFEAAFAEATASQTIFECDYECPTPEDQQTFRLRVLPIGTDGLLIEHSLVASIPAERGEAALEERYLDERGLFTQCSNCRRMRDPTTLAWHWIPDWLQRVDARVSHGLCASCAGYFWRRRPRRSKR